MALRFANTWRRCALQSRPGSRARPRLSLRSGGCHGRRDFIVSATSPGRWREIPSPCANPGWLIKLRTGNWNSAKYLNILAIGTVCLPLPDGGAGCDRRRRAQARFRTKPE